MNVGSVDRVIRLILGAALIIMPIIGIITTFGTVTSFVMMAIGIVFIATGFISFCPLYRIIGMSTKS